MTRRRSATCICSALVAVVLSVSLTGCDDPELATLASNYLKHPAQRFRVLLGKTAIALETSAREHATTEKQWFCIAVEKATYDEKTGKVTLPTAEELEGAIEKKLVGTLFPQPPGRAALSAFLATLEALNSEEMAKAYVDVGCAL